MSNQAKVTNLISQIKYKLRDRRNLKNPEGPVGRHNKIRKTVTALLKYERIELNYQRGDECRGYAERLISEAIRYGDRHKPTMDVANYWLIEKQLVHKLFKVLAPRYENYKTSYTRMWRAPTIYPGNGYCRCVLELRGNIYPPLGEDTSYNKNLIHNVLLSEAKKAYEKEKAKKLEELAKAKTQPEGELKSNVKSEIEESHSETVKADDSVSSSETSEKKNEDVPLNLDLNKMNLTENEEKKPSNDPKEVQ